MASAHRCDALVIHCIDFRFHGAIRGFVERELGVTSYDLLTVPGAAKHLTAAGSADRRPGLLEDIGISVKLHDPKRIVLVNHADCGAYGGRAAAPSVAAEYGTHRAALAEAAALLRAAYPGIAVTAAYAQVDEAGAVTVVPEAVL